MVKALWLGLLFGLTVASSARAADAVTRVEQVLRLDGSEEKPIFSQLWLPREPRGLVLYTHGFTDNSRNHRRLYEFLTGRGFAVAAWDMIGHGTSFEMRGYVDRFEDFTRAMDLVKAHALGRLPAGTPVYAAGYSMGGLVTLRYAQLRDAELAGSFYFSPLLKMKLSWMRRFLNKFSKPLDRVLPRVRTPHGVTAPMLLTDPAVIAERATDPYFFDSMTVHLFRQLLAGMEVVQRDVHKLTKPVLFQVAGQELIVEWPATNLFFARIPCTTDKHYRFWPEMRHELDNEAGREGVYQVLDRWLDEQARKRTFEKVHAK
ncbi:MAG: alpha/beta fold hydrolase [Candidatus Wallbacteria bacterium]|nr:alpha/beta fold hydrolase [Candidatus Wallbacteria bacterium]